jgi:hypothetical protein
MENVNHGLVMTACDLRDLQIIQMASSLFMMKDNADLIHLVCPFFHFHVADS